MTEYHTESPARALRREMGWPDVRRSQRPRVGDPAKFFCGDRVCCIDDPRHIGIIRPSTGMIALVRWLENNWLEEVHVDLLMRAETDAE